MNRRDFELVEERPFKPLPDALLADSSFLGGLGTSSDDREAFIEYVTTNDKVVYLSPYVVEELKLDDADAYGINDWIHVQRREKWVEALPSLDDGIKIHDGPKAGEMMDRAHCRIADLEKEDPDAVSKTDAAFAGCLVQLLGGYGCETVGLIIDDRNAERALSDVISGTYYEDRVRIFVEDDVLEMVVEEYDGI